MNQEIKKCELILDHNPVWGGDGYFCSKCMLRFVPEYPEAPHQPALKEVVKYKFWSVARVGGHCLEPNCTICFGTNRDWTWKCIPPDEKYIPENYPKGALVKKHEEELLPPPSYWLKPEYEGIVYQISNPPAPQDIPSGKVSDCCGAEIDYGVAKRPELDPSDRFPHCSKCAKPCNQPPPPSDWEREFEKRWRKVECSAHERTSSAGCICGELEDINSDYGYDEIKKFISQKIAEAKTATLQKVKEGITQQKEDLEKEAEWYDSRLMNGDWDEEKFADTMAAENLKTEEDIKMRIGKNLCQAEQIDEILKSLSDMEKEIR